METGASSRLKQSDVLASLVARVVTGNWFQSWGPDGNFLRLLHW